MWIAPPPAPPFQAFLAALTDLVTAAPSEELLLERAAALLGCLVVRDDWLAPAFAEPDPVHYRQYLLHLDAAARFSVVSFVWGPGQSTPIHDHTVWGLVGVLRGAETDQRFVIDDGGPPRPLGPPRLMPVGTVAALSPDQGDVHQVANALADRPSISIHVYGGDIGRIQRHVYPADGAPRRAFVSGYANAAMAQ